MLQETQNEELEELDYDLKVQGLTKAASTHQHWSRTGFELHLAVLTGQLEEVKFLGEEKSYNPVQREDEGCQKHGVSDDCCGTPFCTETALVRHRSASNF